MTAVPTDHLNGDAVDRHVAGETPSPEVREELARASRFLEAAEPIEIIRWAEKTGWKCLAVFVDAAPEVLAERFMARALRAIEAKAGDPDQITAEVKRLALMLDMERDWVAMARDPNRTIYDITIYRFDAVTEARVVQLLSTEPQMVYHPASNDSEAFDALDKLQGAALHGG